MSEAKSPIRRTTRAKAKAAPTTPTEAVSSAAPIDEASIAALDGVAPEALSPVEVVAPEMVAPVADPAVPEVSVEVPTSASAAPEIVAAAPEAAVEAVAEAEAIAEPLAEPADLRDLALRVLDRAQAEVERSKRAIDDAARAVEATLEIGRAGRREIEAASFEALKDNVEATRAHLARLAAATTVAEAIELNASFFRAGFEATAAQAKALQAIAMRRTGEAFGPAGEIVGRLLAVPRRD